ncbi:MAG: DUF4249 domain-containing protein [Massilibacteroides sp.]|nr:DUF4249 domain-containing protein [Massilibacteroides sp.]
MKKEFIFFLLLILCSSCYGELDLDNYKTTPKAVLNAPILADSTINASISRTWFFSEDNPDVMIKNAQVNLYLNNIPQGQMSWRNVGNKGMYYSKVIPKGGDIIKIVAQTELGEVWAEDTIPFSKVKIDDIKITKKNIGSTNSSTVTDPSGIHVIEKSSAIEISYQITFQDIPNQANFYFIRIEDYQSSIADIGVLYYDSEPVFIHENSGIDGILNKNISSPGGRTFTDELFKGKPYTLIIKEKASASDYEYGEKLNRKISLYTLSRTYYNYLTSIQRLQEEQLSQNLAELGLAEPSPVFSNVNGGSGILSASQRDFQIINLRTIIPIDSK